MAFESTDLGTICDEIRRRQAEADRLSLVEFDDAEYTTLLDWARRIVQEQGRWWQPEKRRHARLAFLAFTMAFVRRSKYTDDNVFWPDFEDVLGLDFMERRFSIMDDLLWPAYREEGLELTHDDRGRRIVGTLADEMRQAQAWVTQARRQFIEFFQWYYRHCPDAEITSGLLATYREKTGAQLRALDKVLPVLTRDCQALAHVIDYAIENGLYLQATQMDDYRHQVIAALGVEYDPARLRLIRDERSLIHLILELQNHYTSAQFERELRALRGGFVLAPWGDRLNVRRAIERWSPFSYGIYQVEGQEYRVVPHPRLRLEMLDEWPFEQIVHWRGGRFLGYKKRSPFEVTIGRRVVEATPYVRSRSERLYVWLGEVPTGQKLAIDGRLRPESAGADWHVSLRLSSTESDRPALCVQITRLMLYYPDLAHQPLCIWASTGFSYGDSVREDGVRRFHLHRHLVIPLDAFGEPVEVGVSVGGEEVLHQAFAPEPYYLFSVSSRERVQARGIAQWGDREYVLFTRDPSPPQAGRGVSVACLPEPYGAYTIYRVTWENANQPFELQVGSAQWTFQRQREFEALLESKPLPPHLRLKPHQCLRFQDLSLRLYSTFDLAAVTLALEVYDEQGLLGQIDLSPHVSPADTPHFFNVAPTIWQEVKALTKEQYGRYLLRFYDGETLLDEQVLSLMPQVMLENWDETDVHLETDLLDVAVVSPECLIWNRDTQQSEGRAVLHLHPRTQVEPWPEHPALRRILSGPVSGLVSFPDLGETLEIVVHPRLLGFRLYLKRSVQTTSGQWRTAYQPLNQIDYYHLTETVLYVFSAPHSRVELAVGARVAWEGETDANGDLLLESLEFLRIVCLSEETTITLRSGGLRTGFVVRWAPRLQGLTLEEEQAVLRLDGPEDTAVRLWLRESSGKAWWTQDIPCQGKETIEHIPLPAVRPALGYLVAGYLLSGGEVRPAAWQAQVASGTAAWFPPEWLLDGVGVATAEDLALF
jgi:hypothetical protein